MQLGLVMVQQLIQPLKNEFGNAARDVAAAQTIIITTTTAAITTTINENNSIFYGATPATNTLNTNDTALADFNVFDYVFGVVLNENEDCCVISVPTPTPAQTSKPTRAAPPPPGSKTIDDIDYVLCEYVEAKREEAGQQQAQGQATEAISM